jgi:hypothetical protein
MLKTVFENRKDLVKAVEEFTKQRAEYMYAPTFAFKVGDYTINKDGSITSDFEMDDLKEFLVEKGFIQQETEAETAEKKDLLVENKENQQENTDGIEFSIPLDGAKGKDIENFKNMLYSYQYLINKAMGMELLEISDTAPAGAVLDKTLVFEFSKGVRIESDNLIFTYPDIDGGEKLKAYMTLMCMAFSRAKENNRVQAKLQKPENEKYYMRVWLVRIGLGGKGGAETRKALMKNLKGHSAFRTEEEIEKAKEKYRQKKS